VLQIKSNLLEKFDFRAFCRICHHVSRPRWIACQKGVQHGEDKQWNTANNNNTHSHQPTQYCANFCTDGYKTMCSILSSFYLTYYISDIYIYIHIHIHIMFRFTISRNFHFCVGIHCVVNVHTWLLTDQAPSNSDKLSRNKRLFKIEPLSPTVFRQKTRFVLI
jgi:hypothetical protein